MGSSQRPFPQRPPPYQLRCWPLLHTAQAAFFHPAMIRWQLEVGHTALPQGGTSTDPRLKMEDAAATRGRRSARVDGIGADFQPLLRILVSLPQHPFNVL